MYMIRPITNSTYGHMYTHTLGSNTNKTSKGPFTNAMGPYSLIKNIFTYNASLRTTNTTNKNFFK